MLSIFQGFYHHVIWFFLIPPPRALYLLPHLRSLFYLSLLWSGSRRLTPMTASSSLSNQQTLSLAWPSGCSSKKWEGGKREYLFLTHSSFEAMSSSSSSFAWRPRLPDSSSPPGLTWFQETTFSSGPFRANIFLWLLQPQHPLLVPLNLSIPLKIVPSLEFFESSELDSVPCWQP